MLCHDLWDRPAEGHGDVERGRGGSCRVGRADEECRKSIGFIYRVIQNICALYTDISNQSATKTMMLS